MNNAWSFLGGFIAVMVILAALILFIRRKLRAFTSKIFGTANLLKVLSVVNAEADDHPRSLSGCDSLLTPAIVRDFPDFDFTLAKTYAKEYLRQHLGSRQHLIIHKVVISQYLPSAAQKTIVYQAAVSFRENGQKYQKRYNLHYTYLLCSANTAVAANCPNCGGVLGYGVTTCPYCNSRVVNVMGNTWKFTEMAES